MKNDTEHTAPLTGEEPLQDAENDEIAAVSKRLMERNAAVYEELAK